jgi:hypothetical protein
MEFSHVSWSIMEVLAPAIATLLTALVGLLVKWLSTKIGNEQAVRVLFDLGAIVQDVVAATEQTLVSKLKAARADGKLTDAEKEDVLKSALDTVKQHLGERGMAMLAKATGLGATAVEGLIKTKIEATVLDMKR